MDGVRSGLVKERDTFVCQLPTSLRQRALSPPSRGMFAVLSSLLLGVLLVGRPAVVAAHPCAQDSTAVNNRGAALADDCGTLLGLKDTLRGTATLNWISTTDMDDWDGITVAGSPARVTKLELSGKSLDGTIPSSLSDLTSLTELDLGGNALTGSIPDLSALTSLGILTLGPNNLLSAGPIPSWLTAQTSLTSLDLSNTNRTGSIPDLSSLTSLASLHLRDNNLSAGPIPSWLTAQTSLTSLDLSNTNRTGSIPDLSSLTSLASLHLRDNNLSAGPIPSWLTAQTSLTSLDLSNTNRTGAIPDLSSLTGLAFLHLHDNNLSAGPIPSWLPDLTSLFRLDLSNTNRTGAIPDLSALALLAFLHLHDNNLSAGPIPSWLTARPFLAGLNLSNTNRTGAIPDLSASTFLQYLYLQDNNLSAGAIPSWLTSMFFLAELNLSNTNRTGDIPTNWSLTSLRELNLSGNSLTGSIASLSLPTSLVSLNLGNNSTFTAGALPTLSTLTKLETLDLSNTNRTGDIPTDWSASASLRELNLSGNSLTGSIASLSLPTSLASLNLGNNSTLTAGALPTLSTLTSLETLDLSNTNRTGSIPDLSALTSLRNLYLNDNQLTGSIASLSLPTSLASLNLGNNSTFTAGALPSWLTALTSLWSLDLSNTNRTGSIPDWSALTSLRNLYLNDNSLTGSIPATLGNLSTLRYLDLSNNQLTGSLPSTLRNRTDLRLLRLGGNPSNFGRATEIVIASTADTLSSGFTFDPTTNACGSVSAGATLPTSPTLREAIIWANSTPAAETIVFARSLGGSTITLADGADTNTDTDPLPALCAGSLTLDGDVNKDGTPDITLDGTGLPTGADGLDIRSSTNTISGFSLTNIPNAGIVVWQPDVNRTVATNTIADNTVTGGAYGIVVQAGAETTAGAVSNTTIRGNTVTATTQVGIAAFTVSAGSTIRTTTIEQNEVYANDGHGIRAWSQAVNTARTSSLTGLTIQDNHVYDHTGGVGIGVTSGLCAGAYNRVRATIRGNTLSKNGKVDTFGDIAAGAASTDGCTGTPTATQNRLEVTITDNVSEDAPSIGIDVYGGRKNSDSNTVTATLTGNEVWRSGQVGLSVTGGTNNADSNTVTATLNTNLIGRTTALTTGSAGHGLVLAAAAAEPTDSTSSNNTLTISGQHNLIAIERKSTDTSYDLVRRRNNDSSKSRTGNTVAVRLSATFFRTSNDDGTQDNPFPSVTSFALVTIPDDHPEVARFTFTLADYDTVAWRPINSGPVFDIRVLELHGNHYHEITEALDTPLQVCLPIPVGMSASQAYIQHYNAANNSWTRLTAGRVFTNNNTAVCADVTQFSFFTVAPYTPPRPPGGGGGGGGGGSRDQHGNSAAQATRVRLASSAPWASRTTGQINTATDRDYFTFTVPQAGVLVVETTGTTDTVGTVWQAGVELARAETGGTRRNFRLSTRVQAGAVVVAVTGRGGRTGAYALTTSMLAGYLENPGPDSFQSGVGVISGWVCTAEAVEIVLNDAVQAASYGTERLDTESVCGDTDNGFGLLFNWNGLGDGEHTVVARVDGVELGRATLTVTTLGEEFVRGAAGECPVADFPGSGESVRLVWQQSQQNFVIAAGGAPAGENRPGASGVGYLENPSPHSYQSGVGVISGWVCEADEVEIQLGSLPVQAAAYGTERLDTAAVCGDADNGFGLLFNWNLLGDGEHAVVARVDGEELGRATVRVTTLGEEFVRGVAGECTVADFPSPGESVTLEWQQSQQNFVLTAVE